MAQLSLKLEIVTQCASERKLCKKDNVCSCVLSPVVSSFLSLYLGLPEMTGEMGDSLSLTEQWRLLVGDEVER